MRSIPSCTDAVTSARSGVRVLDDVRERLGHDEVRARLDLGGKPLGRDIDPNRQVEPCHDRVDAGPEAAAGERWGQDPVCQLAQLAVALLRVFERLAEERLGLSVFVPERSLSQLERHDRVHQPLLRAVVQIPHDPAAGLVSGGEQARPRGDELVTAVGVRDGGVEQLGRTWPCAPRCRPAAAARRPSSR